MKTRVIKQLSKKEWLIFEVISLLSACLLPFLVKLLIKDPLISSGNDLWNYLILSFIIMVSLNLGFILWKENEWYKLWRWFHLAFFICSFVISCILAPTSIKESGYEGWKLFCGLSAYIILIYSFVISAPLAAIAAFVKFAVSNPLTNTRV